MWFGGAVSGAGASLRSSSVAHDAYFDLVIVRATGGAPQVVTRVVGRSLPNRSQFVRPAFTTHGRIYYQQMSTAEGRGAAQTTRLMSVARDGSDPREYLLFPFADEITAVAGREVGRLQRGRQYLLHSASGQWTRGRSRDRRQKARQHSR